MSISIFFIFFTEGALHLDQIVARYGQGSYTGDSPLRPDSAKYGQGSLPVRQCADQPYVLSRPMVISSSVNGLFVAV